MFFLSKRNRYLNEKLNHYLVIIKEIAEEFEKAIKCYIKNGMSTKFMVIKDSVNKIESNADDALDRITVKFYKKSLLPESREDMLILLNKVDDIADKSNLILQNIYTHNLSLPAFLFEDVKEITKISVKTIFTLISAIENLIHKRDRIIEYVKVIDSYESICDSLQQKMIKAIFDSKIKDFDKILLKDFVINTANLSDLCEAASHMITIINVKRVI